MAIFSILFLGIIGQENVFYDIPERKNAFLGYKHQKFNKSKMAIFQKGLTHGLCSKLAIFPTLFLRNIGQDNVFYHILERKIAFLGYKNKKFKKSKNGHFSRGVNPWFVFKNGDFSFFGGGNIGQKNVFYDILERENAFLGYKNKKF